MNKLIIQEVKKDCGEEAAEETRETSQGGDEFDGGDEEFEEACAEEIAFNRAHAEESAVRARLQKARSMVGYNYGTSNNPEEEEEEENSEGKLQAAGNEPYRGKSWLGKRKRGKGKLGKGGKPGRLCNGTTEQTRRGGRIRINGGESQTAGKEPCRGKSRLGKLK